MAASGAGPCPAVSSAPITACPTLLLASGESTRGRESESSHLSFHNDQPPELKFIYSSLRNSAFKSRKEKPFLCYIISS